MAADDLPGRAPDLARAVRVGDQRPAELVQHHVVVPVAVLLQAGQAGAAAVGPVGDVVRFAGGRGLVAAAGKLAGLVAQRGQPPQVGGDLVGLPDV